MRLKQRLNLNLPIAQFAQLHLGSYSHFAIRGRNLLQEHHSCFGGFDFAGLFRSTTRIFNHVAGSRKHERPQR